MNIEINISGSGKAANIVKQLRQVANDIEVGNHVNRIKEKGECEWEDSELFTTISEVEFPNIEKLLENEHKFIVDKIFEYLKEHTGETEKENLDTVFYDSENIPNEITFEMLNNNMDVIELENWLCD